MLKLAQQGATLLRTCRMRRCFATSSHSSRPARGAWVAVAGTATLLVAHTAYRDRVVMEEESPVTTETSRGIVMRPKKEASGTGEPEEYITLKEVAKHNLSQDAWVIIDGKVFDVTDFHKNHPGGSAIIVSNAGTDVSSLFNPLHPAGTLEGNLAPESYKGRVDPEITAVAAAKQNAERARIASARAALPPVETILGIDEFEDAAGSVMSHQASLYYHTGSLDGISMRGNKDSFRKCRIVPRIMRNVTSIRPQTTIFGLESALPIYISPSSNAMLGHPDGELNMTRGAAKTGIVQGISYVASYPLCDILAEKEEMDEQLGDKMGMVFQVYVRKDREKNKEVIREAIDGGCRALLLTVDSNVGDLRQEVEKMKGMTLSAEPGKKMGPFTEFTLTSHDPALNWEDLKWLQEVAGDVPVYLKGVSSIEDIRIAKEHGVKGCILSNHGGRQLDRARTGFDSLRQITQQDPTITNQIEIYVDGGARRGTDVLMALALGAKGVGLGRPFLFAQAAYGEKGVIRAVRILEREIVTGMQLMGVTKLDELKPEMVECLQEMWR